MCHPFAGARSRASGAARAPAAEHPGRGGATPGPHRGTAGPAGIPRRVRASGHRAGLGARVRPRRPDWLGRPPPLELLLRAAGARGQRHRRVAPRAARGDRCRHLVAGRGALRRAVRIDWGAGWKRVVFDVHNALGIWLLVPVLILSIAGVYFTWPQVYRDLVSRVSPVTRVPAPQSTEPAVAGAPPSLDAVIALVRTATPGHPFMRVELPGGPRSPYAVVTGRHASDGWRNTTTTFVDRYSGTVLEVRSGSQARPGATRWSSGSPRCTAGTSEGLSSTRSGPCSAWHRPCCSSRVS